VSQPAYEPPSYKNWILFNSGKDIREVFEVPLFSDFHYIVGGGLDDLGPYSLINPLPLSKERPVLLPMLYLRVEDYREIVPPDMSRTIDKLYHGGTLVDEIAALFSLIWGIRIKSGGRTREFKIDGDQKGKPVHYEWDRNPTLLKNMNSPMIPRAHSAIDSVNMRSLSELEIIKTLHKLYPADARALIKASRLYQDALWIAESEPELSWIMFVSAIETVALRWFSRSSTLMERFKKEMEGLYILLKDQCDHEVLDNVAKYCTTYMGSTDKFVDFILEFLPPEPPKRPNIGLVEWGLSKMEENLKIIYKHRSNSLHGSGWIPFPMCQRPHNRNSSGNYFEKPLGISINAYGGTWKAKDVPMYLHVFEYIVQGAILNWWKKKVDFE